ncbi:MAG: hypothetical protein GF398_01955 [Chitinivibrionales bacterium]|nr:hypothetical protein [Chitinivibrionales bacterium]
MQDAELKKVIEEKSYARDGKTKLDCASAFSIAKQHRVALADITRMCNQNNIRISKCQLGCFA